MKRIIKRILPLVLALLISIPVGSTLGKYTTTLNSSNTSSLNDISLLILADNRVDKEQLSDFVNSLSGSNNIIFGKTSNYENEIKNATDSASVSYSPNNVMAYHVGNTVYVLSDRVIEILDFNMFDLNDAYYIEKCRDIILGNCKFINYKTGLDCLIFNLGGGGAIPEYYADNDAETVDLSGIDCSNINEIMLMFYHCDTLKKVYFPPMNNLDYIWKIFRDCDALELIDFSKIDLTNVSFPDGTLFEDCEFSTSPTIYVMDEVNEIKLEKALSNYPKDKIVVKITGAKMALTLDP